MIVAHYFHRLPKGHDTTRERELAHARGPIWDRAPDLYFKAFLLRERGSFGAAENLYSSLYLWKSDGAFSEFLTSDKFRLVVDLYGRPEIPTWAGIDARRGPGLDARFVYIEERDIDVDEPLATECAREVDRNAAVADGEGTVVAVVGVDSRRWRMRRILVSENEPRGDEPGTVHQVCYLARPLLHTLPAGGDVR